MIDAVDQIMDVMASSFEPHWGEAWTRRQISDSMILPSSFHRLIDAKGNPACDGSPAAGFSFSRHIAGEEELLLIAVHPAHRGQGLGRKLLGHLARDAKERGADHLFLEMRSNNPAEKLYREFGFTPIGSRADYYQTKGGARIDAITFGMKL